MVITYNKAGQSPVGGSKPPAGLTQFSGFAPLASAAKALLRAPFDAMREQYAHAVRAGLSERSLLASAKFERKLGALERATLGPWARRV
ncbi:hypothetical protein [Thiomonas sp.]